MKRLNGIYEKICALENLQLADAKARKGKSNQRGIKTFDKDREANLIAIQQSLIDQTYKTSAYTTFTIREPKERLIFRLPYKDRIVQHAIMLQLEPIFVAMFTKDTYSCIKGRGIHAAQKAVQSAFINTPPPLLFKA
jgi:RNA-directed DNA polymerase